MGNFISKALATGIAKTYYNVEDELVAKGSVLKDTGMCYTAAHPKLGLWLCGITGNNNAIVIGFIDWDNISKIIVDTKNENVFVVPKDFEKAVFYTDTAFKSVYKKALTHKMSDTGEMAFVTPMELWTGDILPYVKSVVQTEEKEEEVNTSIWLTIVYVIATILIVVGLVSKIISLL